MANQLASYGDKLKGLILESSNKVTEMVSFQVTDNVMFCELQNCQDEIIREFSQQNQLVPIIKLPHKPYEYHLELGNIKKPQIFLAII